MEKTIRWKLEIRLGLISKSQFGQFSGAKSWYSFIYKILIQFADGSSKKQTWDFLSFEESLLIYVILLT